MQTCTAETAPTEGRRAWSQRRGTLRSADEDALVMAASAGDAAAFSELYNRYQGYISKILSEEVRDADGRQDIAQSVFERAWTRLHTLRDPAAFRPWLAQITRRLIVDHHRKTGGPKHSISIDESSMEIESSDWSANDWVALRELADAIEVAIDELSPRDATVLELATSFGFNATEIAGALDIEVGHARVLLHRARRRLSNELVLVHGAA